MSSYVKIFVGFIFIVYIGLSCWGIATMEQGLDYEKLLLDTDPLVRTIAVEIELFHGGEQVHINKILLHYTFNNYIYRLKLQL